MQKNINITLGIETSCDETSICIIKNKKILSMKTYSQIELHKKYGGVVPEIASRDHLEKINILFNECLIESGVKIEEIDLIAYTETPGLVGSLMTGIMFARGLAISLNIQSIGINHLLAHVFTCNLSHEISKNFLCLLISGGHTFIYSVKDVQNFDVIGQTIDDSIGECFDKLSKFIGLGYPGGVVIEKIAKFGNSNKYKFKIPIIERSRYDFSFSGIKTQFLKLIQDVFQKYNVPRGTDMSFILQDLQNGFGENFNFSQEISDISASFQETIAKIITNRLENVIKDFNFYGIDFVVCGGVASNLFIRNAINNLCDKYSMKFCAPPIELCTDNSAMVANVANLMMMFNKASNEYT